MSPELFKATNVIVQGITGSHGRFQTKAMLTAGTTIIAGTSPGKAGEVVEGVPVYATIANIQKDHTVDISVIFVPAPFAKDAILEAITAEVPLIICITEGIPIHDMLQIKQHLKNSKSTLVGPNSPGVMIPGGNKLGIIPANMSLAGHTAVVSRSGTLTYEVMAGLSGRGIGQAYVIGIGGDQIRGTSFVECFKLFENDPHVDQIIIIGEIGGTDELALADYIKTSVSKPIFGYIAGKYAPTGVQLGHAGAILGSSDESAAHKKEALTRAGASMYDSVTALVQGVTDTVHP
jgi:succinyl-CoA synthetase alpha subunit